MDERYLPTIPIDSLTDKKDWVPHFGNVNVGPGKTLFGIDGVHSGTTDSEGTIYNNVNHANPYDGISR